MKQRQGGEQGSQHPPCATANVTPPPRRRHRDVGRLSFLADEPGLYRLPLFLLSAIALLLALYGFFDRVEDGVHDERNVHDPALEALLQLSELVRDGGTAQLIDSDSASATTVTELLMQTETNTTCMAGYVLKHSGFGRPVLDSTVLMLFAAEDPPQYQYRYRYKRKPGVTSPERNQRSFAEGSGGGGERRCTPVYDRDYVTATFDRVAAAFLTSPYAEQGKPIDAAQHGHGDPAMPFFDFFRAHNATFWEVTEHRDNNGVVHRRTASPLQMDLLYTYVNPAAPSFARNLVTRNITHSAQRRYNDWEELRYSLRSAMANVVGSAALQQRPAQLLADVETLQALGYHVDLRVRRTPWERGTTTETERRDLVKASDAPFPIFRTVYLLLSDADQVPAWLDLGKFPAMRVVLHEDMFHDDDFPGVLPTFSSNAIEMGMYRLPGLSRFYLYLNNDFMVGNQVSFFDVFRPISPPRQQLRLLHDQLTAPLRVWPLGVPTAPTTNTTPACAGELPRRFIYLDAQMRAEVRKIQWKKFFTRAVKRAAREESHCMRNGTIATVRQLLLAARPPTRDTVGGLSNVSFTTTTSASHWGQGGVLPIGTVLPLLTRSGLRTSGGFSIPNPNIILTPWERGTPPTKQHHYIVTSRFEGLLPPFNLAHHPYLRDRYVERILLEDIYIEEAHQCRLAYDRTMSPFSIMHPYAVITAAFARARLRDQWQTVAALAAEYWGKAEGKDGAVRSGGGAVAAEGAAMAVVEEWVSQLTARLTKALLGRDEDGSALFSLPQPASTVSMPTAVSFLGPLYGDTMSVRLQAPDLLGDLGLWWLPGARPATVVSSAPEELRDVYDIPDIVLIPRTGACGEGGGGGGANDKEKCREATTGAGTTPSPPPPPRTYARGVESYRKLLHDVAHQNNPEPTYRFDAFATVAELHDLTQRMRDWVGPRATYVCLNDNFDTEKLSDAEVAEVKTAFKELMATIIGDQPPGPWERWW